MAVRTFTKPSSLDQKIARSVEYKIVQPPAETKDQMSTKGNHSPQGITFAHQDKLQKLPIPELEATCHKYLEALHPLQSPKEHHDSKVAIREFLRSEGPELQEKLRKYAAGRSNYIEQFCMCIIGLSVVKS
jgi:carnitine O-acetyltransferase